MLSLIGERGFVRVGELSETFGVSDVTVRGDLAVLEGTQGIRRVHGGAMPRVTGPLHELSFEEALDRANRSRYGLAATVLTRDMAHAQRAWRTLKAGTVKINAVFGGAPGGAATPRRASGRGFGYGPELLDEMTAVKVVHLETDVS